jgi:hypothetical protein
LIEQGPKIDLKYDDIKQLLDHPAANHFEEKIKEMNFEVVEKCLSFDVSQGILAPLGITDKDISEI